jgi:hypothetical protein
VTPLPTGFLPPSQDLLEDDWKDWVIDLAAWGKWLVQHVRPARTSQGWRSAIQGYKGAPDLLLARDGVVLLPELKTNTGQLRREQRVWLNHLGPYGCIWRPKDWEAVAATLLKSRLARAVS